MHVMNRRWCLILRSYLPSTSPCILPRCFYKSAEENQFEYINSIIEHNSQDWALLKNNILSKPGAMNEKNVDAVLLKTMVRRKKIDLALSFVDYLKHSAAVFNIGATNGILDLYYEKSKEHSLSESEKQFILNAYNNLYDKYQVLDNSTAESLLHALCAIDDWKKATKVLEDIKVSGTPSHSAYSTLIGTLFKNDNEEKAIEIINRSVADIRPLQYNAYKEWMNFFLRKYKKKEVVLKHLEKICLHISANFAIITEEAAEEIRKSYASLGCKVDYTNISKQSAKCSCCNSTLKRLKLSKEEFELLQRNIKDKLIIGSDLFLKTSPKELSTFLNFVDNTAPYDIVLDALNIAYTLGRGSKIDKMDLLRSVVDHFYRKNMRILLLGRKHMLNWNEKILKDIMSKSYYFFTDNISQDDPFFITAAILSGSHTDIVSKDLLRGHKFVLKDIALKQIFQRWQWEHQWKVYLSGRRHTIQPPLLFTPCAQKSQDVWHLPFEKSEQKGVVHDGVPDYDSWLCIRL